MAEDGLIALEKAQKKKYDLILYVVFPRPGRHRASTDGAVPQQHGCQHAQHGRPRSNATYLCSDARSRETASHRLPYRERDEWRQGGFTRGRRRVRTSLRSNPDHIRADFFCSCSGYVSKPIPVPDLVGALNDAWTKVQRRLVEEAPAPPAPTAVEFQLELPLHRRTGKISRTGSSNSSTKSNNSSPGGSPKPMSPKAMEEDK